MTTALRLLTLGLFRHGLHCTHAPASQDEHDLKDDLEAQAWTRQELKLWCLLSIQYGKQLCIYSKLQKALQWVAWEDELCPPQFLC